MEVIKNMFSNTENNLWHDSSIEKIAIEYNDIIVELETDVGTRIIVFKNYIAFDYVGQWDENIVETIYQEKNNDIVEQALKKIYACNNTDLKGGGTRDINSDWVCVIIKLIDGICIRIVCDGIVLENK